MLIGLFVVLGLSVLIIGHEAGHFFAAKMFGMRVDEFGFGFPPKAWSRKKGETEYSLNWLPFGGFVRIAGEGDRLDNTAAEFTAIPEDEKKKLFYMQAPWRRMVVILAGVTVNFVIAWLLIAGMFMVGTAPTLLIGQIQPDSPAASAGLKAGDVLRNYATAEEFIRYVNEHRGQEISVDVQRGNEPLSFKVVPRTETGPDQGAVGVVFNGIAPRNPIIALRDGFLQTVDLAWMTILAFASLISGLFTQGRLPQDVVGLVGIFPVAQQVGAAGYVHLIQLIAMISVNLAVINLLPFPALDGGRFVMILMEKIKGGPLPRKAEAWVNTAGFAFLLALMVLITIRDIIRL
jgi:regulator of sigma E protease